MSTTHRSPSENPTGLTRPYYGTWAKQFPPPDGTVIAKSATPQPEAKANAETAREAWGRQLGQPAPNSTPAHEIWARQFPSKYPTSGKPVEPARATWARQFAPKPAAVPTSTAIARTFTASHKPGPSVSLGVRLSGIRGCAAASGIVDRIRQLIQSGTLDALIEAREEIERLPSDHAEGWKLVNELFDALGKLTNPSPVAT